MKAATLIRQIRGLPAALLLAALALLSQPVQAQYDTYPGPYIPYSRAELAQMLAPIALYPDALLSQVLMASTYPIEVIEADRWVRNHPGLQGDALDDALLRRDWDPSVKALCHFPTVLSLMSERITETTRIGNAFLAQEAEVMDVIQELRADAYAQGNLASDNRQTVIVEQHIIFIRPVNPRVVYLPYYNPLYIYGPWPYPAYRPYYWGPPGISIGIHIGYWPDIFFSFVFIDWSYFDWHHHYIHVDVHKRPRFVRHDRWVKLPTRWQHAPSHRRGVAYRDIPTARKYGQYPQPTRDYDRDLRGFPTRPQRDDTRRTAPLSGSDRDRQTREQSERTRQQPQRVLPGIQPPQRTRDVQQPSERDRQARERTEQERQRSQRTTQELQPRQRTEQNRQIQQPAGQARQRSQRITPSQAAPERTRPTAPRQTTPRQTTPRQATPRTERSRDNIFNRVDKGQQERRSSERGRSSRQSPVAGGSRDSSRVKRSNQEKRDQRVPARR
jgi:hypothetical protein